MTTFRNTTRLYLYCTVCTLLAACSTSKKVSDYPERIIDRPYTLLEGMSEVQVNLTRSYSKSTSFYDLADPIPLNFFWVHAVSDDFSFIWFILPLGFRYQWIKSSAHFLGLQFYNHIGDPNDPNISPFINAVDRIRLNDIWEIQTNTGFQSHIRFKQSRIDWNLSVTSGPRWQLHRNHAIYGWLGLLREIRLEGSETSLNSGATYLWSFSSQAEIELRLIHVIAGHRTPASPYILGSMGLRYRW